MKLIVYVLFLCPAHTHTQGVYCLWTRLGKVRVSRQEDEERYWISFRQTRIVSRVRVTGLHSPKTAALVLTHLMMDAKWPVWSITVSSSFGLIWITVFDSLRQRKVLSISGRLLMADPDSFTYTDNHFVLLVLLSFILQSAAYDSIKMILFLIRYEWWIRQINFHAVFPCKHLWLWGWQRLTWLIISRGKKSLLSTTKVHWERSS